MLYKYCLTMVLKKRRGKDGMPKKHDPKKRGREREKRWHAKEAWPNE